MGGRGYSSATKRAQTAKTLNMSKITVKEVRKRGYARGIELEALERYKHGKLEDAKMIAAQLEGDTTSEYGKLAQAIDNAAHGRGTDKHVYRGMAVSEKTLKDMINKLERGENAFPNRATLNSWSTSSGTAFEFAVGNSRRNAQNAIGKKLKNVSSTPVMFEIRGGLKNAVDVDAATGRRLMKNINGKLYKDTYTEQEFVGSSKNKYRIVAYDYNSFKKQGVHMFLVEQD